MRILRIRLKNINSLRGEHSISFDASPLREAGLFGIVGATGSGKSTLLDCITLALYGRVPRIGLVTKTALDKGGVILTRHEKEALAEVKYVSKRGVFTAIWQVSKTRNNTFRDIEMKVFNEAGDLLTEKLSTAPEVNRENIGLDYEQFMKSILLSQGEFAKFLQSDKNKRAELLEKITGTRQFRNIGKKAFREYNQRRNLLDQKEQLIKDIGANLLTEEEKQALTREIDRIKTDAKSHQTNWDTARQLLELKLRLAAQQQKLEALQAQISSDEQVLEDFKEKFGPVLRNYELLYPFREQLLERERLQNGLRTAENRIGDFMREIGGLDTDIAAMVGELGRWLGKEEPVTSYLLALRAFRDEVKDLQQQRDLYQQKLKETYHRVTSLLTGSILLTGDLRFDPKKGNTDLRNRLADQLANRQQSVNDIILQQGWDRDGLHDQNSQIATRLADLTQLKIEIRQYLQQQLKLRQLNEHQQQLKIRLEDLDLAGKQVLKEEAEQAFEQAKQKRGEFLDARNLDALRGQLKDGQPCPLCGATHHPYVHQFTENLLKASDDYEKTRVELEQQQKQWQEMTLEHAQVVAGMKRDEEEQTLLQQEIRGVGLQIEAYKTKLALEKVQSEEKVTEWIATEKGKLELLDECQQFEQWKPLAVQLVSVLTTYDDDLAVWTALTEQLQEKYQGKDIELDVREREQAMQTRQSARQLAVEQMAGLEAQRNKDDDELKALQNRLELAIRPMGFAGVDEARALLIPEQEQKQYVAQQQELLGRLGSGRAQWKVLKEQWELDRVGDDTSVDVEQQQVVVGRLKLEVEKLRQQLEDQRAVLIGDNTRREQMGAYVEERKQLLNAIRPWEMLNRLIGDATGNKFNNKAQELTLQHLLILANERMKHLHARYYLLEPDGDDDLRVADGYMGGEVRTVRSLSGGETFILSLALALGLSDLASRDVKIDSLFIDEGFGSLDPDTLEEAMSTLEQLQNESNKMVGIISHVESLKDRIYTQIRLEKGNSGFSTMRIFPEANDDHE